MSKTRPQVAAILSSTSVDNSKDISSGSKNNKKLAKPNFKKNVRKVGEFSFLTPNARGVFTQLRQAFTEAPIFQNFDLKYQI